MEPLWDRLGDLTMPVTVVAGARDAKFRAIGLRIVRLVPGARMHVVAGGHVLPLENPAAVADSIGD
jgi:pimeloyl-ACP methyl ester carboxylesterase